jgi:hypothetical protein
MIVGAMKDPKLKLRILHDSHTLGSVGRKNSKTSIGSHGHRMGVGRVWDGMTRASLNEEGGDGQGGCGLRSAISAVIHA